MSKKEISVNPWVEISEEQAEKLSGGRFQNPGRKFDNPGRSSGNPGRQFDNFPGLGSIRGRGRKFEPSGKS